jgi:hypothetical protein
MKKGKANVPPQMRSQYARAQEMENYRQQMMESQRMGADGLPVFNLYVRTSLKNVSYICCGVVLYYLHIRIYYIIIHIVYYGDNIPCNHRVVTSNLHLLTLYLFLATKTTCYYAILLLYKNKPHKQMWYPCGSFKGDEKSAALCQSYADNGMLAGISKKQLDAGVGGSLFRDLARLEETIIRGYPQLRKDKGNLEFGYKLSYKGLNKEQEKIQVVEIKEQKGFFDGLKNAFGGN